ncbi:H-NS histone family protein [Aestuariibacter sp. AA17]|uniref:DNA-binding protein n=1 Tax=Fluctibacter corallii TaxID=2984329 RepID=A0ABT3A5N1_9ALTE|nr:H-NS family nucleoid-associated regulatory protein [Aestuariibacter sp. AA17]MCV2883940.1 H-NS histone family protein [Aestuariibacter sp. AA17]
MNEFLSILTHGRRLQGAVKDLSLEELTEVADKLNKIIETRRVKEEELRKVEKEKLDKIDAICKQLEEAGLALEDLQSTDVAKKLRKTGSKRPVKYILRDKDGSEHTWTGIGRMPKVFSQALADGKDLDDFLL